MDIVNGAALELSAEAVSFGAKLTSAMTTNDHSAEEIRAVLDGALAVAGLADEDVAKAMLVQKAMTATGVTPEVMAQGSDSAMSSPPSHHFRSPKIKLFGSL